MLCAVSARSGQKKRVCSTPSMGLSDYRCRFYGLSHCEGLFPGSLHIVNVPCMKLHMLDDLVLSSGAYHESAVTVNLFRQKTSQRAERYVPN